MFERDYLKKLHVSSRYVHYPLCLPLIPGGQVLKRLKKNQQKKTPQKTPQQQILKLMIKFRSKTIYPLFASNITDIYILQNKFQNPQPKRYQRNHRKAEQECFFNALQHTYTTLTSMLYCIANSHNKFGF